MSKITLANELNQAEGLINEGRNQEALTLVSKIEKDSLAYYNSHSTPEIHNTTLETLLKCKKYYEKIGKKTYIAYNYFQLGEFYFRNNDFNASLEYGMKCLELWEELKAQGWIAAGLDLIGRSYNFKGKLDLAIEYCKRSLLIKEISPLTKVDALYNLGTIYFWKGEMQQSLKYNKKSLIFAEENKFDTYIALNLTQIGVTHFNVGLNESGVKYHERSIKLSEKIGFKAPLVLSLCGLITIYDSIGNRNQAQDCLKHLKTLVELNKENKFIMHGYMVSKAIVLKSSGRSRDRGEAELLLKQVIEDEITNNAMYLASLIILLTILFEELRMFNNLEIIDEIKPLITRFHNITEKTGSYFFLAQGKLYEAKIALIQLDFDKAKKLLTEGQRVADLHGFLPMAQAISAEHDLLLRQQDMWEDLIKNDAPISERIDLAAFDGVLEQMRSMRTVEPLELEHEIPILLLIISKGGVLIFSYPFTTEWRRDDEIFSSFLSAFTSFSGEYFSEELDRAKFGEFTVLLDSIEKFSVCYLYRGQTYPAKLKLTKFIEEMQNSPTILQDLYKFSKTSQVLETKDNLLLENLIQEIFVEISQ
ncbi:MAG: tetratricopeptide repeat protein [Promethearchaeota archaeon]|jgi:tetratricopeptide (TPR) repeat protein